MALRPLAPAPTEALGQGWELVVPDAGRSKQGLRATVTLFNGTPHACQTLALGDPTAQQALAATCAGMGGMAASEVITALLKLTVAVEGVLRQMDAAGQDEDASQATILVALARHAGAALFHAPDGEGFASIPVDGHMETWPLKVKGFRRWLARLYYDEKRKAPGAQAIQDALGVLEGQALYDGPEHPGYTRLAELKGAIYFDLGNAAWEAVEITVGGWQVVATPPVKFRRARGRLPLPAPATGGSLQTLRQFVNLSHNENWRLVVAWLLVALRPRGPYPVLVIYGEQGSAKSTLVRVLRDLVDPNTAALRTTPREERDLVIAATHSWLMARDNLSHLPDWRSEALCRLATGSGFATRELSTDADETIFAAQRPLVLNGIEEVATRGDLLDRAIILYLPTIPDDRRKDEKVFWREFEQARPQIRGALLDIVSSALQHLPTTTLSRKPRMADFALWACAAADACGWTAQDFLDAYKGVREAVHELTLEASPLGPLVHDFAQQHSPWEGTASELLTALETPVQGRIPAGGTTTQAPPAGKGVTMQAPKVGSDVTKQKGWPKNVRALSNALRRLAPTLRAVGVEVTFIREPGGKRQRTIKLAHNIPQAAQEPSQPGTDEEQADAADEREYEVY